MSVIALLDLPDLDDNKPTESIEESTESSLISRYLDYIKKHWFLTSLVGDDRIDESSAQQTIQRTQWYCNLSGLTIHRPDNHHTAVDRKKVQDIQLTDLDPTDKERVMSMQLYDLGLNSQRTYNCGHCFIDICILSNFFAYLNFCYAHIQMIKSQGAEVFQDYIQKRLVKLLSQCLVCHGRWHVDRKDPLLMYYICPDLDCGTIIRSPTRVPCAHLNALSSLLSVGDVVDTEGYRGTGLYIYEGSNQFTEVPRDNDYPIWSLDHLKRKGYLYYLLDSPVKTFDRLLFDSNVYIRIYTKHFTSDEPNNNKNKRKFQEDQETVDITYNIDQTVAQLLVADGPHDRPIQVYKDDPYSEYWTMNYPFSSAREANILLQSALPLICRLTEHEHLIFELGQIKIKTIDRSRQWIC